DTYLLRRTIVTWACRHPGWRSLADPTHRPPGPRPDVDATVWPPTFDVCAEVRHSALCRRILGISGPYLLSNTTRKWRASRGWGGLGGHGISNRPCHSLWWIVVGPLRRELFALFTYKHSRQARRILGWSWWLLTLCAVTDTRGRHGHCSSRSRG